RSRDRPARPRTVRAGHRGTAAEIRHAQRRRRFDPRSPRRGMRYVLDSCVALKWVLPEADSDKALRLRATAQAGVHALLAPDTFAPEVGHALTRAERKGIIPVGDADIHLLNILSTAPRFFPS